VNQQRRGDRIQNNDAKISQTPPPNLYRGKEDVRKKKNKSVGGEFKKNFDLTEADRGEKEVGLNLKRGREE